MASENYEFKRIEQSTRQDVYRVAKPLIARAIREFVRVWGVNVDVYQVKKMGISGHYDASRATFDREHPIYTGSAFLPSVVQSQVNRGRLALMEIFDRKSPRIFFDKHIELPNGSLVVVRDMDRVMNYLIDEKRTAISPNSEDVYQVYNLVPYNVIDKKLNSEELESATEKREFDITEFELPDDYDNNDEKESRPQTFTNNKDHTFNNISVIDTDEGINDGYQNKK